MDDMHKIAAEALNYVPPDCRLRPDDGALIARHSSYLLGLEPLLVKGFYDCLYAHPPAAAVLGENEREERERTLSKWWRRTVGEPLDEGYFAWMAMVGLVHVVRNVPNPAMLAMTGYVVDTVSAQLRASSLPADEADRLGEAIRRVCSTVASIITFGYDHAVVSALYSVAGMPEALLRRLRDQEVENALSSARATLSAGVS